MNDWLKNNTAVKVLSLFISVILWIYVLNVQNPPIERMIYVTPQDQNLKDTYILETKLPNIKIKIRGLRESINSVEQREQVEATMDLKTARLGTNTALVKVTVPTGMELVDYEPRSVNIVIDTILEREFPLDIMIDGEAMEGYILGEVNMESKVISVKGRTKKLNLVKKGLVHVNVTSAQQDITSTFSIDPIDSHGNIVEDVEVIPHKVQVYVPIHKLEPLEPEENISEDGEQQVPQGTDAQNEQELGIPLKEETNEQSE